MFSLGHSSIALPGGLGDGESQASPFDLLKKSYGKKLVPCNKIHSKANFIKVPTVLLAGKASASKKLFFVLPTID